MSDPPIRITGRPAPRPAVGAGLVAGRVRLAAMRAGCGAPEHAAARTLTSNMAIPASDRRQFRFGGMSHRPFGEKIIL